MAPRGAGSAALEDAGALEASQAARSGGRRNKRKNFQPRNIRTDCPPDQPLDGSLRKRTRLADDDDDARSSASGCSSACSDGQAVDLSVRPNSASSGCDADDDRQLSMNMLLWQRSQLDRFNQLPAADLSEAAVRHLIAGLYSLPGKFHFVFVV